MKSSPPTPCPLPPSSRAVFSNTEGAHQGQKKRELCSTHKRPSDVDQINAKCRFPGCDRTATFQHPGGWEGKRFCEWEGEGHERGRAQGGDRARSLACRKHRTEDMIPASSVTKVLLLVLLFLLLLLLLIIHLRSAVSSCSLLGSARGVWVARCAISGILNRGRFWVCKGGGAAERAREVEANLSHSR